MIEMFANNAVSKLAIAISSTATAITLNTGDGALFPNPSSGYFFRLTLVSAVNGNTEIAYCTARSGDVLTVKRNQESTPYTVAAGLSTGKGFAFAVGDGAALDITAGMMVNIYSPASDQQNVVRAANDTGAVNAIAIALNPTMGTSTTFTKVIFKAAHTNTGSCTITINGGTTYALKGLSGAALVGGEIQENAIVEAIFNGTAYYITSAVNAATTAFNGLTMPTKSISDNSTNGASTAFVNNFVSNALNPYALQTTVGNLETCLNSATGTTLTTSAFGSAVQLGGASTITHVPTPVGNGGATLYFFNNSGVNQTLQTETGNFFFNGASGNVLTLAKDESLLLIGDNYNWCAFDGSWVVAQALAGYVSSSSLTTILESYETIAALATTLAGYTQLSQAIGLSQSYNVVTGSRSANTIYTNTGTKPMTVMISLTFSYNVAGTATAQAGPSGSLVNLLYSTYSTLTSLFPSFSFIVQPGQKYQLVTTGTLTINNWSEMS